MKQTPEQQRQAAQAKAAGERRVVTTFTAEQEAEWRVAVAEEEALKPQHIAAHRRRRAAEQEPGFFGDLRRAVSARLLEEHRRGRPVSTSPLGIDARRLESFREGVASLTDDELRRLIDTLGLQLVQAIPRAREEQVTK